MSSLFSALVWLVCENLTDAELAAFNNAAQIDLDPRSLSGYEKVKHLFTEADGTLMHADTKAALAQVVAKRLGG